ncbi:hypothetical protein LTR62_006332 [Meristemomyces frigidus]|uniref:Uncharacterized protein n=1 Tax=Meristemomyces frigidus TaxID=1508187 RepID=A0AAN7TD35_9PEZI|nr:hypothetical protein LTR62_006332 [Meristemomyces frigidus]
MSSPQSATANAAGSMPQQQSLPYRPHASATTRAPSMYAQNYMQAVEAREKEDHDGAQEIIRHNLTDPTLPRYWQIKSQVSISASTPIGTGQSDHRSLSTQDVLAELREDLDFLKKSQAEDAPEDIGRDRIFQADWDSEAEQEDHEDDSEEEESEEEDSEEDWEEDSEDMDWPRIMIQAEERMKAEMKEHAELSEGEEEISVDRVEDEEHHLGLGGSVPMEHNEESGTQSQHMGIGGNHSVHADADTRAQATVVADDGWLSAELKSAKVPSYMQPTSASLRRQTGDSTIRKRGGQAE